MTGLAPIPPGRITAGRIVRAPATDPIARDRAYERTLLPRQVDAEVERLDALSRKRPLSHRESLSLERLIRRQQHRVYQRGYRIQRLRAELAQLEEEQAADDQRYKADRR